MAKESIYLFVPNIIGYLRVVLMLVSFYYMPFNPWRAVGCYLTSQFLDAFDGHAARTMNQCTKFGAVLDMLTDRCSTLGLIVALSHFYSDYQMVFQSLIVLDISSHWVQVYSSLLAGTQSHKAVAETGNALLRLYYTSRTVLFLMCAGNELFLSMLYLMHFFTGPAVYGFGLWKLLACVTFPICVGKNCLNIIQLSNGFQAVGEVDMEERSKIT